jgi:hypothetical protein
MRAIGLFLLIAGVVVLAAGLGIGLPFTGIYLLGFIGTGGREAGRELFLFLPATLVCCGVGAGCIKLGSYLRRV